MTTDLAPLISQWFEIYPMGIKLKNYLDVPPIEAIDILGYSLALQGDALKWQIGAWCNLYLDFYGTDVYHQKAAIVRRKPQTIEVWAYVERNVSLECRVDGVLFECHRLVASIKDKRKQKAYLRLCRLFGLKFFEFENWLKTKKLVENFQPRYSDRLYEAQQDTYNNEIAYQEQVAENQRLTRELIEAKAALPPQTFDPGPGDYAPEVVRNSIKNVASFLPGREWSSVEIFQNGDVKWKK